MKRVALIVGLCACVASTPAGARALPDRAQVEAALNAHEACAGPANSACHPPLRYRLTRARCLRLPPDPIYPGRILCRYSGTARRGRDAAVRLHGDCAYFRPARRRGWRVDAYPDADMCG